MRDQQAHVDHIDHLGRAPVQLPPTLEEVDCTASPSGGILLIRPMPHTTTTVRIDDLLSHQGWLRTLALGLVHDESTADDLVQDTWVAALRRPPRELGSSRSWLRTVLMNRMRQNHRASGRRERNERVGARPESLPATSEIASRAELHRMLTSLVLELPEPARTTMLLRYFEELPPRTVAARLDEPVETVRARLRRTRARLRAELDRAHGGDRAIWHAAFLPVLALPAQASGAAGTTVQTFQIARGLLMGTKTTVGVAAISIAAVLLVSAAIAPDADAIRTELTTLHGELADVRTERDELARALAQKGSRRDRVATGREDAHVADVRAATAAASRKSSNAGAASVVDATDETAAWVTEFASGPRYRSEAYDEMLAGVEWVEFAKNVSKMPALLKQLGADRVAGVPPSPQSRGNLQKWNGPVLTAALQLHAAELPGSKVNGCLTQPTFVANSIAAALEALKLPLTPPQSESLGKLADTLSQRDERERARWDDATLALSKLLQEAELRDDFFSAARRILTPAQTAALSPESVRDRVGLDLYSSALIWVGKSWGFGIATPADVPAKLAEMFEQHLGFDEDALAQAAPIFADFAERLPRSLVTRELDDLEQSGTPTGTTCRASAKWFEGLLRELIERVDLSEAGVQKLVDLEGTILPFTQAPPDAE